MKIRERYRLVFEWTGIRYEGQVAVFDKAVFKGPVLKNAAKIKQKDSIELDFTQHNMQSSLFLPKRYYIADLSWGDVIYGAKEIELIDCKLDHHKAGSLKELKDGMRFYIDCSKHELVMHYKNLVYPAWVVNEHGEELK